MDSGGLGNFRMNRYSGTNEATAFHEVNVDDYEIGDDRDGGGIGGAPSFGRNLSTCFGGRGLNARPKIGMGRGYIRSNAPGPDDGYFTAGDNDGHSGPGFLSPVGLGNTRGFQPQGPPSGAYFSAGTANTRPFGGASTGLLGRGPPRSGGYDDGGGFSNSGRIGGARVAGGSGFGMGNVNTLQRSFFNDKQYGQEYSSTSQQRYADQDEDMEPPPRHHNVTYSSMESRGPIFKRGGLRGASRSNQVSRNSGGGIGGGRFSKRPGSDRGSREQPQTNTRRPEPLLATPIIPPTSSPKSSPTSRPSRENNSKSFPAKVGVHLDITPPIFKEMSNRGLGDKVFIMIPKQAKTVMDVKIHVATLLGVDVFLVNFFIDGFRIPENEDVEAFACISKNSLVQVVKPGYRPPCDLSKFNKTGEDKTSAGNDEEETQANSAKKKSASQNEPETLELEHEEEAGLPVPDRKRRPDYMEPSLLEPSLRRCRYSNISQAGPPSSNVTTLTPITRHVGNPSSSPKKVVIEIVLSDDDDDAEPAKQDQCPRLPDSTDKSGEGGELPSSTSSPGELVIADGSNENQQERTEVRADDSAAKNQVQSEGERIIEFSVEDEVGNDSPEGNSAQSASQGQMQGNIVITGSVTTKANAQDVHPQSQPRNCNENVQLQSRQSDRPSENWLNASGQIVGRGHRKSTADLTETEVVDLSSQEEDDDDDDDGSSTTFEEESNETFFTISAVQSIPVAVFKSIEEESRKQMLDPGPGPGSCQSLSQENWDLGSVNQERQEGRTPILPSVTVARSALLNPCANQFSNPGRTDAQVQPNDTSILTDNVPQFQPTATATSTPVTETETITLNRLAQTDGKTAPIDEVNQIKCGSLILYQVMERVGGQVENSEGNQGNAESGERQLSDVKCCRVIGRSGLKLTLEPVDQDCGNAEPATATDESDMSTRNKIVFVDFKDMINLQELVQE